MEIKTPYWVSQKDIQAIRALVYDIQDGIAISIKNELDVVGLRENNARWHKSLGMLIGHAEDVPIRLSDSEVSFLLSNPISEDLRRKLS